MLEHTWRCYARGEITLFAIGMRVLDASSTTVNHRGHATNTHGVKHVSEVMLIIV